jgi:hypothetical protein
MSPKTQFSEIENNFILELFNNAENKQELKPIRDYIPEKFYDTFKRIISYKILLNQYLLLKQTNKSVDLKLSTQSSNLKRKALQNCDEPLSKHQRMNEINNKINQSLLNYFESHLLNGHQAFQCRIKLKTFFSEHNFKEIQIKSDGMCFLNAIRQFFTKSFDIQLSLPEIRTKIESFFQKNHETINYEKLSIIDYLNKIKRELDVYFNEKIYNIDIVDTIAINAANIFKIDVYILNISLQSNVRIINSINVLKTHEEENVNYIVLLRETFNDANDQECSHYNLIINNESSKLEKIDQQIENEMQYDDFESSDSDDDYAPSKKKTCKCGSLTHFRTSHHLCPYFVSKKIDKKKETIRFFKCARSETFSEKILVGEDYLNFRYYCGEMTNKCMYCDALFFRHECKSTNKHTSSFCCDEGKVKLPEQPAVHKFIARLLMGTDKRSETFRQYIRAYNAALSFTSLGAKLDDRFKNYPSNYSFSIKGKMHHRIGSLLPLDNFTPKNDNPDNDTHDNDTHDNDTPDNENPKKINKPNVMFAQLYIYDTDHELDNRFKNFNELDKNILKRLQELMHRHNPYVKFFKQIALEMKNNPELKYVLKADSSLDRRVYNLPCKSEVAAVLPGI